MWSFANRFTKTISDVTVGTVIVLVHVALADREQARRKSFAHAHEDPDHIPEHQRN